MDMTLKGMNDKVTCAVCGRSMTMINNRHLASHSMTADEYRAKYPGAALVSEAVQNKLSARSTKANAARKGVARSEAERAAIKKGITEKRVSRANIPRGPMSEEQRRKLSESHKRSFENGRVHPRQGKPVSEQTRAKISASLKGRKVGPEAAMKALATKRARGFDLAFFRGRTHTDETKATLGRMSSKRFLDDRAARREPMLARMREANLTLINGIDEPVFRLRCETCLHTFTRTPQRFQPSKFNPRVCDQCFPQSKISLAEDELAALVTLIFPDDRIVRSDTEVLAPFELDIYLPSRNLAIEYCGLYWHSDLAGKSKWYHRMKLDACRKAGIRLITIFEDEWIEKREIVENMLRNAAGGNSIKLNARSLQITRLTPEVANAFIGTHHVGGRGRASVHYGLMQDGEVVSAMTFTKGEVSRRRSGWEINRFVTRGGTTVRGGASRLFSAFLSDHDPEEVVSYADLRWGTGGVYEAIGFVCEGLSVPNYWYFRPNEMRRYHRYALRKKDTDPPGMTEWQARQTEGWNRIFDCGHARWVWKRS